MNKNEFIALLHEVMETDEGDFDFSTSLDDIAEWDSISLITFMAVADENFGQTPSPDAIADCKTVEDLRVLFGSQISD